MIRRSIHSLEFNNTTVWNWLQLGIIPLVLVLLVASISFHQGKITREAKEAKEARTAQDRLLAEDRFEQQLLMSYLDRITDLMLKQNLREAARAHNLTVMGQINGKREGLLLRFLYDSDLMGSSL